MIEPATVTAWYVFGVVPAGVEAPPGTRLVESGRLAAVTAEVPLDDFGEDVLPARLNDRRWLEEKVQAHEEVLDAFVGRAAVVPLRFGAVFRDLAGVERLLRDRRPAFESGLARLDGRVELGVKAWFDASRLPRPAATTGRAYLERRRDELGVAREAAAFAASAHERLARLAVEAVANRPQPPELTGRSERMLLNAAYLVDAAVDVLPAEVARLNDDAAALGVSFELTGPWPPHNFVRDEEEL